MAEALFSASWYRVASLKPRLRGHVQLHRQRYRGQTWYVLQDHAAQRYHRFSPAVYGLIGLLDGQRTVQQVWEMASTRLGDEAPTQDEVIQLLMQLHVADVLQCDVPPDISELWQRYDRQQRRQWQSRLLSPLSWRLPLCDPERFLTRLLPYARPFFGPLGAVLWFLVVGTGMVFTAVHWQEMTHNVMDRVLTPHNLALLWVVYPLVKCLHELGHAFATKAYGGEVHEMGVMLLILTPFPYVDASAASAFRSRWQRMLVGAAGMIVELFLASLALFVWLAVEPGTVRSIAYNVMFIAGISTVLFNGNPLLRYDGYYILADYLELPNLSARAHAYLTYLGERYLYGRREATSEATSLSERAWFLGYATSSSLYRLAVLVTITLFIANKFFILGAIMAVVSVCMTSIVPVTKFLAYLTSNPRLRQVRWRAVTMTLLIVAVLAGLLGGVPVPLRSRAEGVLWIPEHAMVRAGTDGFVERVVAPPDSHVQPGDVLLVCSDPALSTRLQVLELRLQELQTRYTAQWLEDQVQADILKEEMALLEETLARVRERVADLTIRSTTAGLFVLPKAQDMPGRFVRQGTQLAYVLDFSALTARVVVSQDDIDLVRQHVQGVSVRLAERVSEPLPAMLIREVPMATEQLPSVALGSHGGGNIAVDPTDSQGVKAFQKLFQLDLALPGAIPSSHFGGRLYARFEHGWEPLAQRWYRGARRLFLARFHV